MITQEVRSAIYTLIERHCVGPSVDGEERRKMLLRADDACEFLATWLDTQDETKPTLTLADLAVLDSVTDDWDTQP